ncbi:MAG: efflux RND transporter periplasmic adaptor subunit [Pseudomonadota bacterium]|nr:efflux RND transporter periplasmic adaptor subunit [Pseudomonadota bacterium]
MNKSKILLILLLASLISACESGDKDSDNSASMDAGKEIDYWVAPMDANYRRDQPGKSPMGMDLVPVYKEKKAEKKIAYWVAPMDANYRRDKAGKSPMGMDLVPVYEETGDDADAVIISPAMVQNLGVRTAVVEKGRLGRMIDTVGYVSFDESLIGHIHLRIEGWIEKLYVTNEGERVIKGDPLFELYSPTLVNAQEEYLEALKSKNPRLIRSSRDRLSSLDISSDQIDKLRKTRKVKQTVTFRAPQDGIVTSMNTPQGMFVKPATRIMSLVDLSKVWVQVEVFEQQAGWVKEGQPAEISLSFLPGQIWQGDVVYVYPELDKKTRTLRVRLQFDNPDESLKPNMYADVKLYSGIKQDVLFVPREAIINSGRMTRVLVAKEVGKFYAREVKTGIESGEYTEILDGLQEGEKVVTSGQFLIDSEASLKGSLTRMSDGE